MGNQYTKLYVETKKRLMTRLPQVYLRAQLTLALLPDMAIHVRAWPAEYSHCFLFLKLVLSVACLLPSRHLLWPCRLCGESFQDGGQRLTPTHGP